MKALKKSLLPVLLLFLNLCPFVLFAGEQKDTATSAVTTMAISYLNMSNDTIVLTAILSTKNDKGLYALKNAVIEFFASAGEEKKKVGQLATDDEGSATVKIWSKTGLPADKEGKSVFTASFSGKGKYQAVSESVTTKQAKLVVNFSKVDTVRYILVSAVEVEADGTTKPIGKLSVTLSIPRLFTPLKIGEVTLEEDGTGKVEYPGNIVGDSLGNITIIAKIEDNDLYGNIQGQSSITWGIPKQYYLAEMPTRELWTPIAPLWMIVTLIIMLTGVWAHYIYAIVQLVKIKRSSREKKL